MFKSVRSASIPMMALAGAMLAGCATEQATVRYSYVVEPNKGLPPGMKTVYIEPAQIGPNTDPKWSDLCATKMRSLIQESVDDFGTQLAVTDRRDTDVTFSEADLAAAGMSDRRGGSPGQLMAADGAVKMNINVKEELEEKKDRTLDITGLAGGGGHGWGAGGVQGETREVSGYKRTLTVQTEFKLLDTANNRVWALKSRTQIGTEETRQASPLFGSSRGVGDLSPADQIISALVDQAAREFVSELVPCRIDVVANVQSSSSKECAEGVRMLRGGMYNEAIAMFDQAIMKDAKDHRAAFGAGVAAEASGQYDRAMGYYQRACVGSNNPVYQDSKARVEAYGKRVQKS